jgi:hypothetical protein
MHPFGLIKLAIIDYTYNKTTVSYTTLNMV